MRVLYRNAQYENAQYENLTFPKLLFYLKKKNIIEILFKEQCHEKELSYDSPAK